MLQNCAVPQHRRPKSEGCFLIADKGICTPDSYRLNIVWRNRIKKTDGAWRAFKLDIILRELGIGGRIILSAPGVKRRAVSQ
jgi:hypothetical protein